MNDCKIKLWIYEVAQNTNLKRLILDYWDKCIMYAGIEIWYFLITFGFVDYPMTTGADTHEGAMLFAFTRLRNCTRVNSRPCALYRELSSDLVMESILVQTLSSFDLNSAGEASFRAFKVKITVHASCKL